MKRLWLGLPIALLALVVVLAPTHAAPPPCTRIVAFGDLHGGIDSLTEMLRVTGLVDDEVRWSSTDACLVLVGDLVDRGDRSRELLDYVMTLQETDPSRVYVTLGNHEVMDLVGDLRYVTPGEFAAYGDLETDKLRRRGYDTYLRTSAARALPRSERREAFDRAFPPGWFGHREAFAPDGPYGAWLLQRPVLIKIGSTLFVHGGIEPGDAAIDLETLNERIVEQIVQYLSLRESLIDAEWLSPLVPFGATFAVVEKRLEAEGAETSTAETARRFLELRQAIFARSDGPLWTRKLAQEDEEAYGEVVTAMLRTLGVERIVVGHTSQEDHRIKSRFDGRVFLIDTGAGPAYGSAPSALEIEDGTVRAVYPDEVELLVEDGTAVSLPVGP